MQCQLDHVALNVRDMEAMLYFYGEVLGLEPERVAQYEAGEAPFPSVRLNADTIIDFFPQELWAEQDRVRFRSCAKARQNHLCVAVSSPDFEQLRLRLEQHQTPVHDGPAPRWGAHGTGISIYFHDPEGNMMEVRHYPQGEET